MPKFSTGQWFRLTDAQEDTGDFGQRHAQAGSFAYIDSVKSAQENCYLIVAWPSNVGGFWSEKEVSEKATALPLNHADIPFEDSIDLFNAVALVFADGDADDDSGTVIISARTVITLREASANSAIETWVNENIASPHGKSVTIAYQQADALAAMVGLGDRYHEPEDPFAGKIDALFPEDAVKPIATVSRMAP